MYCLLRPCFQTSFRLASKIKLKYVCICIGLIMILDFFGAFTHFLEITYDSKFVYPYEGDVHEFVNALRHNEKPDVDPINEYNYTYKIDIRQKCEDAAYSSFRVVYIVKSALEHFERRMAIRNTWGFEKRFFDVPSRTIFVVGVHQEDNELQAKLEMEAAKYKDIVQADFRDMYYNNTIKTMISFKWLVKYCQNSKFYMFVDDDMYVSVRNVLRFIRNPANYPDYLKEPKKIGAHKREIKDSDKTEELGINNSITQTNSITLNKNDSLVRENLKDTLTTNEINHKLTQDFNNETLNSITVINTNSLMKKISDQAEIVRNETNLQRRKKQIFDFELPEDVRLFAGFVFVSSPHRHKSSKWYVSLSEYPYHLWPTYITTGAYILSKEALLEMYYTKKLCSSSPCLLKAS
ncbi:beta-1,3-galactosyltransferase brn isoform X1 [Colletes gigas]|uniref:beta-1,3-galactosyltransferase brn isoform X1 n=1 Tax=Colletes gigas TaxID=935657 RepID=UPI001C9B3610|nr:beta-1,3-galactosyltransferase brn isoform X1 [Colletes gigas]